MKGSLYFTRKDFNFRCHLSVTNWKRKYIFTCSKISSVQQGLTCTHFCPGDDNNQIHFEGYQVSNQCMALVNDDCFIPTLDAPELGYIKESSNKQYVPDVFYKVRLQFSLLKPILWCRREQRFKCVISACPTYCFRILHFFQSRIKQLRTLPKSTCLTGRFTCSRAVEQKDMLSTALWKFVIKSL